MLEGRQLTRSTSTQSSESSPIRDRIVHHRSESEDEQQQRDGCWRLVDDTQLSNLDRVEWREHDLDFFVEWREHDLDVFRVEWHDHIRRRRIFSCDTVVHPSVLSTNRRCGNDHQLPQLRRSLSSRDARVLNSRLPVRPGDRRPRRHVLRAASHLVRMDADHLKPRGLFHTYLLQAGQLHQRHRPRLLQLVDRLPDGRAGRHDRQSLPSQDAVHNPRCKDRFDSPVGRYRRPSHSLASLQRAAERHLVGLLGGQELDDSEALSRGCRVHSRIYRHHRRLRTQHDPHLFHLQEPHPVRAVVSVQPDVV